MLKTILAPYLGYIATAAVVAVVGAGIYTYNSIYSRGYDAGGSDAALRQAEIQRTNDEAILEAHQALQGRIIALTIEKERLENDLERLDLEARQDPDAGNGGIKRSSVQRLNAVR